MIYRYFLLISMMLYAVGFAYLCMTDVYSLEDPRVMMHLQNYIGFVAAFAIAGVALSFILPQRGGPAATSGAFTIDLRVGNKVNRLADWFGAIACGFCLLYLFDGGFQKIQALGSNIEAYDFRFIGLGDRPFYIAAPMELARRLLLPFCLLVKLTLLRLRHPIARAPLCAMAAIFLMVSVVNLDRGPILLCIVLIAFHLYSSTKSIFLYGLYTLFFVPLLGLTGALFTFLQYNNLDFTWKDIRETVDAILINRIILSPVRMSQGWVFDNAREFADPLMLAYSRISVLWGGAYVGSHSAASYYVAPVGIIGDTFRNLGTQGSIVFGFFLGMAFLLVQRSISLTSPLIRTPFNFIALILAMYIYYGNVFSLGPFVIFMFLVVGPTLVRLIMPKLNRLAAQSPRLEPSQEPAPPQ